MRAIVTMSKSLGVKNVFEGVETREELEMVKQLNGEIIQCYFFSKPLEASQINDWLNTGVSKSSYSGYLK